MKNVAKGWFLVCAVLCGAVLLRLEAACAAAEPTAGYRAGQYWEYVHEGPRPGALEPKGLDGRRIVWVLGGAPESQSGWTIGERYTNDPNVVTRLRVGDDRMATALEIGNDKNETLTLAYEVPVPHQRVDLAAGGRLRVATALVPQPGDYRLPVTIAIDRLEDETVETPAGSFVGCRQYRSVTESLFDIKIAKIAMREHRQWWYSDAAGATVKEIYRREPVKFGIWSRDGYSAVSTLAAHGVREGDGDGSFAVSGAGESGIARPADRPAGWPWRWLAWGAAGAVVAVLAWRVRRSRRGRPGKSPFLEPEEVQAQD